MGFMMRFIPITLIISIAAVILLAQGIKAKRTWQIAVAVVMLVIVFLAYIALLHLISSM